MTDELDQIRCKCGKWVLRYEEGAVHTICSRCKADVALDVEWLLERVTAEIEGLEEWRDELLELKKNAVTVIPKRKMVTGYRRSIA